MDVARLSLRLSAHQQCTLRARSCAPSTWSRIRGFSPQVFKRVARREAYLTGWRGAVWEVQPVYLETNFVPQTAGHFGWPIALVKRALTYAKASPDEVRGSAEGGTHAPEFAG